MLTDSVSVAPNHTPMESQQPEQGGQPTQNEYPTPATPGSEIEHKYVPTMSSAPPSNLNSSIINAAATASAIVNSNPHSTSPVDRKPIMPPSSLAHGSVSLKVLTGQENIFFPKMRIFVENSTFDSKTFFGYCKCLILKK